MRQLGLTGESILRKVVYFKKGKEQLICPPLETGNHTWGKAVRAGQESQL